MQTCHEFSRGIVSKSVPFGRNFYLGCCLSVSYLCTMRLMASSFEALMIVCLRCTVGRQNLIKNLEKIWLCKNDLIFCTSLEAQKINDKIWILSCVKFGRDGPLCGGLFVRNPTLLCTNYVHECLGSTQLHFYIEAERTSSCK